MSKDLALQDAKKKYLSSSTPDKLHPYFWSSFRLTGNTEPFVKKSKTLSIFIVGIIAILVIVLIRKKKLKKLLSFLF